MKSSVFVILLLVITNMSSAQKTADKLLLDESALNFIVMGDWGRNGADHQKEVAAQMAKVAEAADIDFLIATGDNFYPKGVRSEFDPQWKYSLEDIYSAFPLMIDWYPVLGNHDYGSNPDAQVAYSKISRRWNMPARYYSKKINLNGDTTKQVLIAFIDTTPLIKGYYEGNGHAVHGQDTTAQKRWLDKVLADRSPNIKWKFVVGHHPMYTGGGRTESRDTRTIRSSLQPMFEKYGVDAYITGHEHSLQHIMGPNGKVHHFISGAASERTNARRLPATLYAGSEYGFMLFSVKPESTRVQIVDYKGSVLYVTPLKK